MLNLAFGWIWITMGFLTGAALGMGFHKDRFMGGYDSWPRRLTRLGHIAFFGTGLLNILVALSAILIDLDTAAPLWTLTSWFFVIGGVSMPLCCLICAKWKHAKPVFALPVLALTIAGVLISVISTQAMIGGSL